MFAILETGSKQYKVEAGDILEVELLDKNKITEDNIIDFDSILLLKDEKVHIGQPFVKDALVRAKVLEEIKAPKVIIFKKKAKKQYRKTRGHRQILHRIQIEQIGLGDKIQRIVVKEKEMIEPAVEVKPTAKPKAEAVIETKPKPAAKPKMETTAKVTKPEPETKPKIETAAKVTKPEPAAKPKTGTTAKVTKPKPAAKPKTETAEKVTKPKPAAKPKETKSAATPKTKTAAKPKTTKKVEAKEKE